MKKSLDWIREHQSEITLALMMAAGGMGVWWQTFAPARPGDEMWRLAQNLIDQGTFANPFGPLKTGPTAANPPLCPLILAAIMKIFRVPWMIYNATALASIVANAFVAVLLPRVSKVFYGDPVPGVIAAVLWIASMEAIPGWDTNFTVLGVMYFCLCTWERKDGDRSWRTSGLCQGAIAGLLFLLNPSVLLILLPWVAYLLWRSKENFDGAFRSCAALVVVLFAFMTGWGVRNYVELGAFVFRTNLGMTLYASNNDCAQPSMIRDLMNGCYQAHHPNSNLAEAEYVLRVGEVQYDRRRIAETKAWIRSHPGGFLKLSSQRFVQFWFPPAEFIQPGYEFSNTSGFPNYRERWMIQQHTLDYAIWGGTALSVFGLALMIGRREPLTVFLLSVLAIYPVMYYAVVSDVRYRYPVLWLTLLPAGYFLCEVMEGKLMRTEKETLEHASQVL